MVIMVRETTSPPTLEILAGVLPWRITSTLPTVLTVSVITEILILTTVLKCVPKSPSTKPTLNTMDSGFNPRRSFHGPELICHKRGRRGLTPMPIATLAHSTPRLPPPINTIIVSDKPVVLLGASSRVLGHATRSISRLTSF
jgi:hypothetical protein